MGRLIELLVVLIVLIDLMLMHRYEFLLLVLVLIRIVRIQMAVAVVDSRRGHQFLGNRCAEGQLLTIDFVAIAQHFVRLEAVSARGYGRWALHILFTSNC